MGLAYDIHLGPQALKWSSNDKVAFRVFPLLCWRNPDAGALAFRLAYTNLKKDDLRANLVMPFKSRSRLL